MRELKKTVKKTRRGKAVESIATIDYIDQILESYLKTWYRAWEKDERCPIYMQDGTYIHSSAEVCSWLHSYRIEVIEWPNTSRGLKPTENMWKGSKGKIRRYSRLITKKKNVFEAVSRG